MTQVSEKEVLKRETVWRKATRLPAEVEYREVEEKVRIFDPKDHKWKRGEKMGELEVTADRYVIVREADGKLTPVPRAIFEKTYHRKDEAESEKNEQPKL